MDFMKELNAMKNFSLFKITIDSVIYSLNEVLLKNFLINKKETIGLPN